MTPRLKWHERLLCWLLFRIEAKHGLGAGFDEMDLDAMQWFINGNNMLHGYVCSLMRDYVYVCMAREYDYVSMEHAYDKERRND